MSLTDDFWDISSLIPKRKTPPPAFRPTVETVAVEDGADASPSTSEGNRLHFAESLGAQSVEKAVYVPKDNPLLLGVRVFCRKNAYALHHRFRKDAISLLSRRGRECPFVSFFSYIPQYSQLSDEQLSYYLYFRDEANEGRFIKTTQSYFLLYVYEIINLPDMIPPAEGASRMARAWGFYRKGLPAIDKYMVQWLMDYCLIHSLPCPSAVLSPFLHDCIALASLKEFYLATDGDLSDCRLEALLSLSSDYKYRSGRYATGEHADLFLTHLPRAAKQALRTHLEERKRQPSGDVVNRRHDAFCGALCAAEERYTLDVMYYSVCGNEALRSLVTAVLKYAENRLRAYLSIKSRLSLPPLAQEYKDFIDAYFEATLPKKHADAPMRPDYEVLYDAPSTGVSIEEARNVEHISWQNTEMLIDESLIEEAPFAAASPAAVIEESLLPPSPLDEQALAFLLRVLSSDGRAMATDACGMALAEGINEFFSDSMGDVVLDTCDGTVCLIEDYETEVRELLASHGFHE